VVHSPPYFAARHKLTRAPADLTYSHVKRNVLNTLVIGITLAAAVGFAAPSSFTVEVSGKPVILIRGLGCKIVSLLFFRVSRRHIL